LEHWAVHIVGNELASPITYKVRTDKIKRDDDHAIDYNERPVPHPCRYRVSMVLEAQVLTHVVYRSIYLRLDCAVDNQLKDVLIHVRSKGLTIRSKNIVGYLRISDALLRRRTSDGLFAARADGFSMNRARIREKTIQDGDYLIVDGNDRVPKEGEIILSIIDGAANIKRYHSDKRNKQIVLISDSTEDLAPIYIHPDDDFFVNGKVIDVIKKPNIKD
ncbi:MAG TPA: S24 family peptidase, partial [Candidatus Binatia bacterium]|nr:S24 family peptidase [Candidatus Binatia bacterium]